MKKLTSKESGKKENNVGKKSREQVIQQLWNIFSQSPIPTLISSKDGRFVKYNDAMAKLTGYTHEEVPDIESWVSKLYPDETYRKKVNEITKKSMDKEIDIKREEFTITRKDGENRHIAFSVYDIINGREPTDLQVVQGEDITECKQAEVKLNIYRLIVESAQDAIFYKDLESRYILANKKTAEAFGLPLEKVIGKNDYEIMTNYEEAKKNIEDDRVVITKGKTREITKHLTGADGKEYWFQAIKVPQFDDKRNSVGLVGIARDITDLKNVEKALMKSENKFRELAQSIRDVFFAIDRNFNCTYWNKASEKLAGISTKGALGKSIYYIFPKIKGTEVEKCFVETIEKQTSGNMEYFYRCEDTEYVLEINTYPTRDGLSVFIKDITDRKNMENNLQNSESELRKQKSALEQKNIALREVISQIEVEKNKLKDDVITNVHELILPVLEKIKVLGASDEYINLLRNLLEKLSSSFGRKITHIGYKLTPREIEISTMIENGLITKEISILLNISGNTVEKHRENIRKKLGIYRKNVNLRSYLKQLHS